MGLSLAYWKRGLPLAALVAGVAICVQTRGAEPRPGQAILFSSPDGDADTNNLPSLSPKPPESLDLEGVTRAPESFGFNRGGDTPPLPPGPGFSGESARQLDLRKNWTLLTPAEILGAATPEKMMGISERNAFGQPKNLTALERYAERQSQLQMRLAKTNALLAEDSSSAWNFSGDPYGMSNSFSGGWRNPEAMANPLFNSPLDRQNENSPWPKSFDPSAAMSASASDLAQQADMERFRQLLNPGSASAPFAATASADGIKTSLPRTMLGINLDPPSPNRIGASFTPLSSSISKPPGLPKLPTVCNAGYTSAPPAAGWAPQQAPWLAPGPQPLGAPQRNFNPGSGLGVNGLR